MVLPTHDLTINAYKNSFQIKNFKSFNIMTATGINCAVSCEIDRKFSYQQLTLTFNIFELSISDTMVNFSSRNLSQNKRDLN